MNWLQNNAMAMLLYLRRFCIQIRLLRRICVNIVMEYQLWSDAGQIAFSLWLWDFVCSFIVKWSSDRIYFLFGVAGSIYQFNCFVGKFLIRCIPIP